MKKLVIALVLAVVVIVGSACGAKTADAVPAGAEDAGVSGGDTAEKIKEDTGEVLTCFHASNYSLTFDHTLTVNAANTSLTHILKQGSIALASEYDSGSHDTLLHTVNPQTLDFEYMGVVGVCSVDAAGEVTMSAEGFCEDGIVYLTITESWGGTDGTMVCDGSSVPFSAPGYTATHSGASGMGEEFLITDDAAGHTLMKPFLGGEGYHSWTLQMDISLVPLVPEE
ncbi:MAG: hypothetical protein DRI46_01535 [Chloroflexi bacterium]|nr:MAG: hypothetical protein DRI46_01535 [Chloroflexota bacterium]